jgi:hypothetical protein
MRPRPAILIALALVGMAGRAEAVRPVKSIFTALDLRHCSVVAKHPDGNRMRCEGLPGYPIYLAEGDLRFFVSIGEQGEARRAASQTLAAFNTPFRGRSRRATVEWRFIIRDEHPVPYAMILRYFTKSEKQKGQVLVVTRVTDTETCHVAYIDALANLNAIVLARRVADERARKFDCRSEPEKVGATGKSPM